MITVAPDRMQLPDDLQNEVQTSLEKASAYLKSGGNTAVLSSFKDPPSRLALVLLTFFLLVVFYVIAQIGDYQEIRRNWAHYQCQPSIAPFAKFYGHDPVATMNFCVGQAVKEHAGGVITPIYRGISEVSDVADGVYDKVKKIEGGVSGLLSEFKQFVANFINSFRLLGAQVQVSASLFNDLFKRVWGIFIAFMYAAISAITFGENLVCNPLVTFVAGIAGVDICCFAPDTPILLANGQTRPICDISIGTRLANNTEVTSIYKFAGTECAGMVRIHGVHVSGNHSVWHNGGWIRSDAHPDAVTAERLPEIWCLGTSSNRISVASNIGELVFTDYEESSDPAVIAAVQRIVEVSLNGEAGSTVDDYSLGLDPTFEVKCASGIWKSLNAIKLGELLAGGGRVVGLIDELCETVVPVAGWQRVSAAQLIWHKFKWRRAANIYPATVRDETHILLHLMVSGNCSFLVRDADGVIYSVRDYTEWQGHEAQQPYDDSLKHPVADTD